MHNRSVLISFRDFRFSGVAKRAGKVENASAEFAQIQPSVQASSWHISRSINPSQVAVAPPPATARRTKRSSMPPSAVPNDLIEEILLRSPPEEPELLVRAALVCKRWFRLISDPRFRRRFRELDRAAPMLATAATWTGDVVENWGGFGLEG